MQYGVAVRLVVALVGVAGCYVIGLLLLVRLEAIQALDGKGLLQVLLTMTGLYFLLAVAIVGNPCKRPA